VPIDYLHVFSFSPRPGTAAASIPGRLPAVVVKRRVRELRALGEEKRARFHRSMDGRTLRAVVERRRPDGAFNVLTGNYIRAAVAAPGLKTGAMADIVLSVAGDGRVTGRVARAG
jgi:threonylcarbamoyladenosine tRNA methylthiotransferase MtaB